MRNWNSWPQPGGGAAWETDQADGEADGEVGPVSSFSTLIKQNKDEVFFYLISMPGQQRGGTRKARQLHPGEAQDVTGMTKI